MKEYSMMYIVLELFGLSALTGIGVVILVSGLVMLL